MECIKDEVEDYDFSEKLPSDDEVREDVQRDDDFQSAREETNKIRVGTYLKTPATEIEAFDTSIINLIVDSTNKEINQRKLKYSDQYFLHEPR